MWHDIRLGLRVLLRRPLSSAVAAATLALGIAGATVVLTLIDAVLIRPLPYGNADRLGWLWGTTSYAQA